MVETPRRKSGFGQGNVTIDRLAVKQGARNFIYAIRRFSGQIELIIGLFVGTGVAGGAHFEAVGKQNQVVLPQIGNPFGTAETCRAGPKYDCICAVFLQRDTANHLLFH